VPRRRRSRRRIRRRTPRGTSVRVTTTRGSGPSKTTSYRTGGLSITGVGPTGRVVRSPNLTIRATVRDYGGGLSKNRIRLYLDGSEKSRFRYDQASGNLSYYVGRTLFPGTHEVRIEAESEASDKQGRSIGSARKRWTFTVVRR
jgi:ribosomal protein L34E